MTNRPRDPKFYVVGGPVQPGRDCYLQRYADAELLRRVDEGEYCHVLAQRQTGKTSLAAATVRKLRGTDKSVAMVDLTQASEEDPSENAGRWYYSIAYRIVRELRIKSDVQAWWAERSGLTNLQRLREFFLEVVLEETDKPVAIFFDRIEATLGEPLAQDLFSTIRACYDARATDVDFQRLTFVMLGSAAPDELVKTIQGSPFEISVAIPLPDFSPQELAGFAAGLGEPLEDAEQIVRRVWSWTRGHPYLSQKVFRGLARRKDEQLSIETVDELVQSQFLAAKTINEEPHLSAIAKRLLQDGGGRSARLNLYGRIRKGVEVMADSSSAVQKELLTAGIISVGGQDELRVRNEIYAMVYGTRWVNQNLPFGIKGVGIAAAIIACVLAAPIWYTEYLPRPYVRALSAANQDYEVAEDAYESLHMFPGYGEMSDRLFEDFLTRMGKQANSLMDITRVNNRLAPIPGGAERGRELLADFWERRASIAADVGDRDGALIALLEAMQVPNEHRRSWAAELVGQDYRNLRATLHTDAELRSVEVDEEAGLLTLLDVRNQANVWSLDGEVPQHLRSLTILAEERLELVERRIVDKSGALPQLFIRTSHPRADQVEVNLRGPSGQQAQLNLAEGKQVEDGLFAFAFADYEQLRSLSTKELAGNWTLSLTDLERGSNGELLGWKLSFADAGFVAGPDDIAQPIPEPRSSVNAESRLSPGGRMAISWPADSDTQGSILVWDLSEDAILARIPRSGEFRDARFVLRGERVITLDARRMVVWESATGRQLGEVPLSSAKLPKLSANGRYAVINTLRADQTPGIVVWDLQRMRRTGQMITAENAGPVTVDSTGKYLAIGGRDPWVRVWSLADGVLVREFEHGSPLRFVEFDSTGSWLATDDLSSTFRLWNIKEGGAPIVERFGISPWYVNFANDTSSVLFGSSDRAFQISRLPEGLGAGVRLRHSRAGAASLGPILMASRNLALTTDASRTVKLWSVPVAQASLEVPPTRVSKRFPGGTREALSFDGQRIAIGTTLGDVRIHAVGAPGGILLGGRESAVREATQSAVISLAFSADRRMLASSSIDGRVRVWNAANGALRDLLILHPDGGAHDLMFVDNGQYLISASRREVLVTDISSGEISARLRIQANHPRLAVASDTGEVFIADDLNGVTLWNWRVGESERIVGSEYRIRTVAVTADGTRMVTASDERELVLWDLNEGVPLAQTAQAAGKVDDMWVTPENRLIVQAGYWLQSVGVLPVGLTVRSTRLLSETPASVQPGAGSETAFILSPSPSRPLVSEMVISEPSFAPLDGDPEELRMYWRDRLAMTLDEDGNAKPLSDQSLMLPMVDSGIH
jgi:WD40 repeat protein